jgi:hypothetical protein
MAPFHEIAADLSASQPFCRSAFQTGGSSNPSILRLGGAAAEKPENHRRPSPNTILLAVLVAMFL